MLDDSDNIEPKKEPESPDVNGQTKLDDLEDSPPPLQNQQHHHHGMFTELHKPSTGGMPPNALAGLPPGMGMPVQPQGVGNPGVGLNANTSSPHDVHGGILSDYQNL